MIKERIIQIIPANEWTAICKLISGVQIGVPVVCFALKELSDDEQTWQQVVPMGWSADAGIEEIEKFAEFQFIKHSR